MENFCRLDHVQGAMILDDSGLVVEEHFTGGQDSAHLAHVVLRSIQVGGQLAEDLGKAPLNQQYIEYADLQITAEMLAHDFVLVILAESGANLGRVRLEIRKNKSAVEKMLA
ncbi:MAG: roadblock/LC7 domain-containing protein [Armatimonadetes bacterium]|nr:roadblock/LC7 domain-containing protein [Armatimonadota bacterium]